jgi:endonuclease/exonuclease/phosphatase family metal-dependent hydrolase
MQMTRIATKATAAIAVLVVIGACTTPARLPPAHITSIPVSDRVLASRSNSIKVVSLNTAHSRSMGFHQLFQSGDTARINLDAVATMLERENPDIVALQEVDGSSVWSGSFDHVDYLAREAGYSATVRGTHLKTPGLDYGTALMSRYPLDDSLSVGFGSAISVVRKGFVISSMQWPGQLNTEVDVVSVHLHPLRSKIRARQVKELIAIIENRGRPVIVMGDFNDDWYDEDSAVRLLGETLGLKPQGPRCEECFTHRRMKKFVDWILVSSELSIDSFQVMGDEVSDHFAVSATLSMKGPLRDQGSAAH